MDDYLLPYPLVDGGLRFKSACGRIGLESIEKV